MEATFEVSLHGKTILATGTAAAWLAAEELVKEFGGIPSIVATGNEAEQVAGQASDDTFKPTPTPTPASVVVLPKGWSKAADGSWVKGELPVSTFGKGNQVEDLIAKGRIEKLHASLKASGITVDARQQLYATGTRLAEVGYETQAQRKAEHDQAIPVAEAINRLVSQVKAEGRRSLNLTARDVADSLDVGSSITVDGYAIDDQALRGICGRLESPALSYLLGLNERKLDGDAAQIAEVLRHELLANPKETFKLRVRESSKDCFAVLSPSYTEADAPDVLSLISRRLPEDARGTFAYDPKSTQWELRANVFTQTPVSLQAVGEPFEGYVSFKSRDNGTGRLNGGGGISLLRCLNASTYTAEGSEVRRIHRGGILVNVGAMVKAGLQAIEALCAAWGRAGQIQLEERPTVEGIALAREIALGAYFRGALAGRRSELAGVLPGRTETHVKALTEIFPSERRNGSHLTKADLGQAFTKYAQRFDGPVRREVEGAAAEWIVANRTPELLTLA